MIIKAKGKEINTNLEPISIEFDSSEEFELFVGDIDKKNNTIIKFPESMSSEEAQSIINSEEFNVDWKSKFYYLSAEYQNYKKRIETEKETISKNTKTKTIEKILEIENDISVAIQNLDDVGKKYLEPIFNKLNSNLNSMGLVKIQTDKYDSDIHEVISILPNSEGEEKIVSVVSNGWMLDNFVIKYPKIILSK
jgi:molecular chaperone GrpE